MSFEQFNPDLERKPFMLIAAATAMKHFVFPDGTEELMSNIKKDLEFPQLYAWKNDRKELDEWVEYKRSHPQTTQRVVVDSSAFSAWTKGIEIDIDEYIEYINEISDTVYWIAELDQIPGKFREEHTAEEVEQAATISWNNYLYMIDRVNCPKKILPIFHEGEDFKYLTQILEYKFPDGSQIEYMGISPDNGVSNAEKMIWIEHVWRIIKNSSNPNILTHYFGMTSPTIMNAFPSMSADSSSWIQTARFGNIMVLSKDKKTWKNVYVGGRDFSNPSYVEYQGPDVREEIDRICTEIGRGVTLEAILENPRIAFVYNLYSLNDWRRAYSFENLNYKPVIKQTLW